MPEDPNLEPRHWLRFAGEPAFDPDAYHAAEETAERRAEQDADRMHALLVRAAAGVLGVMTLVGLDASGWSLGPGGGERALCAAAGGHEIGLGLIHRCDDGN